MRGSGDEATTKGRRVRVVVVATDARAGLVIAELTRSMGVEDYTRVVDVSTLTVAIRKQIWDVVILDWHLSSISVLDVVATLHELRRAIPLIIVSDRIGEEAAADAMIAGARDLVVFDNINRLSTVVRREVLGDTAARNIREVLRTGLLAHSAAVGITVMSLDGRFLDSNDTFLELIGYSRADLAAGVIRRAVITPPDLRTADERAVATLKTAGQLALRQMEYVRKDGSRVPVLVTDMLLDDGTAVGLIVVDVTAQKRTEEELREATVFLDSIVENIPLMIFVKDARELRFERINRAGEAMLGKPRVEMLGKNVYDLYPKEQADFFDAKDREAMATTSAVEVSEEPVATPNGERWVRTIKMAIRDDAGIVRHLLGISEDITSRRELTGALDRAAEQLRQAQKMEAVGRLAGGVAHDFNNLLSVIVSYTELALQALPERDPVREEITEIAIAAQRAAELTRQLLAFSRHQASPRRVIDLNDVLAGMQKMLRRVLEESIDLKIVPGRGLWSVSADPTHVEQVVMNLVVNARDAMVGGGSLAIETANVDLDEAFVKGHVGTARGPHVVLTIRDNGTGMDKATLSRIFEPFFTTKAVNKGTGLGLSTVYGIVQQAGGTIWVTSELGVGTTFDIYLPQHAAPAEESSPSHPQIASSRRVTETILVVEDDPQLLRLTKQVLEKRGYVVLATASPTDALLMSERHAATIDLLLTDVVMPRMNGRELADRLTHTRPTMKVLFMSGYTGDAVGHHGVLDPGVVLMDKPFTPLTLLAKVAEMLETR